MALLARVLPVVAALRELVGAGLGVARTPGSWCPGRLSELPLANRETVSTPAEMNTSPSPALMAWKAIRVVCTDEEQ